MKAVIPGTDGKVRAAEIRVKDRTYIRPVVRLIKLPPLPEWLNEYWPKMQICKHIWGGCTKSPYFWYTTLENLNVIGMGVFQKILATLYIARKSLAYATKSSLWVFKLEMHRSDTLDRYRLRSGHFLRFGYWSDETRSKSDVVRILLCAVVKPHENHINIIKHHKLFVHYISSVLKLFHSLIRGTDEYLSC